ncbi:MAG TPA: hypothetical protein VK828_03130 [Terriglobales bacterium]|jgi:hypothetical protein|nr:hypothetical protein [Terriglobales bacterium]
MSRSVASSCLALILTIVSAVLASAQVAPSQTDIAGTPQGKAPVAYLYVTSSPSSGVNQINGYAVASTGALTALPGSPFSTSGVYDIALNGGWLFGTDGNNLYSFSIAANGSLTQVDELAVVSGGGLGELFLDHTGASLYADYYTENNEYMAYSIDNSNGLLTYIDNIMGGPGFGYTASFIGNNEYAYSSSCYHFTPSIYGLQRSSDGGITLMNINPPFPSVPGGGFYCPFLAAADPTNHLAIAMQPLDPNWNPVGPYQLATYTADSSGNLTTKSTYSKMPSVSVGDYITDYWMSPTGKLLAIAGPSGLQVFHFNGAYPITTYTGLLTTNSINQVFWDNNHHLYALSGSAGLLYVFTVTEKSVTQAPGSPYSITGLENMIVLPKS